VPLTLQSATGLFSLVTNAITALTTKLSRFGAGTVSGAIVNAVNAGLLTQQGQNAYQVAICRAATSNGKDLWSFCNDYFISPAAPLPGVYAGGTFATAPLTVGRYAPVVSNTLIPAFPVTPWPPAPGALGTIIQTKTGPGSKSIAYAVIADATNPNYNSTLGGYVIATGQSTVVVTVQAIVIGAGSNVLAGSLSVPAAATVVTPGIPIDYTTQGADITNGVNQETDPQLRVRFQKYISSLAKGNSNAIASAVLGVQAGLSFTNNDQLDSTGNPKAAWFTIVVDDGSGAISGSTLAAVTAAINGTNTNPATPARSEGIGFSVIAPNNVVMTIALTGTIIQPGFTAATVRAAVKAAIIAYTNANGVGGTGYGGVGGVLGLLQYLGLLNVINAFVGTGSGQGLAFAGNLTVNGGTSDIPLTNYQLARATSGSVTVL
jgi:baseplate J-like protein